MVERVPRNVTESYVSGCAAGITFERWMTSVVGDVTINMCPTVLGSKSLNGVAESVVCSLFGHGRDETDGGNEKNRRNIP